MSVQVAMQKCQTLITVLRFAYIDFATAEAKTTAIKKTEEPLDGRRLLIKDGTEASWPRKIIFLMDLPHRK